jgi:hypothetical protein
MHMFVPYQTMSSSRGQASRRRAAEKQDSPSAPRVPPVPRHSNTFEANRSQYTEDAASNSRGQTGTQRDAPGNRDARPHGAQELVRPVGEAPQKKFEGEGPPVSGQLSRSQNATSSNHEIGVPEEPVSEAQHLKSEIGLPVKKRAHAHQEEAAIDRGNLEGSGESDSKQRAEGGLHLRQQTVDAVEDRVTAQGGRGVATKSDRVDAPLKEAEPEKNSNASHMRHGKGETATHGVELGILHHATDSQKKTEPGPAREGSDDVGHKVDLQMGDRAAQSHIQPVDLDDATDLAVCARQSHAEKACNNASVAGGEVEQSCRKEELAGEVDKNEPGKCPAQGSPAERVVLSYVHADGSAADQQAGSLCPQVGPVGSGNPLTLKESDHEKRERVAVEHDGSVGEVGGEKGSQTCENGVQMKAEKIEQSDEQKKQGLGKRVEMGDQSADQSGESSMLTSVIKSEGRGQKDASSSESLLSQDRSQPMSGGLQQSRQAAHEAVQSPSDRTSHRPLKESESSRNASPSKDAPEKHRGSLGGTRKEESGGEGRTSSPPLDSAMVQPVLQHTSHALEKGGAHAGMLRDAEVVAPSVPTGNSKTTESAAGQGLDSSISSHSAQKQPSDGAVDRRGGAATPTVGPGTPGDGSSIRASHNGWSRDGKQASGAVHNAEVAGSKVETQAPQAGSPSSSSASPSSRSASSGEREGFPSLLLHKARPPKTSKIFPLTATCGGINDKESEYDEYDDEYDDGYSDDDADEYDSELEAHGSRGSTVQGHREGHRVGLHSKSKGQSNSTLHKGMHGGDHGKSPTPQPMESASFDSGRTGPPTEGRQSPAGGVA